MTDLVVRRLQIDLDTPPSRRWNGGDAFRTAFFNALSFSFPAGEQFFIDSIRRVLAEADPALKARFDAEQRGFIGQEATHRHIHDRFNAHLLAQGFVNRWESRILRRRRRIEDVDARIWLGITAATEHFTAFLADHLLTHPEVLAGADERWRTLWLWHASEESEHRSVAFDLYRASGGDERWRRRLFWLVTHTFLIDLARQTLNNLWHDGAWWRASTWTSAWRLLLAPGGVVRACFDPWRRYLRADFHPGQCDGGAAERWLAAHGAAAVPVAAPHGRADPAPG